LLPTAPRGYETVRLLGSGGFGEVTLARHIALGRLVAIKYLRATAMVDSDALERFKREARVLATLEDPAVVRVYDVRFSDPEPSIIMEYVPGQPLDALLEQQSLSASEKLTVLADVAHALEAAHAKGIAHRDVKPANVFVLGDGRAKLGDFGLARISADQSIFRTSADNIGGTPAYLPPEVALGTAEPGPAADAYSFAVMAYEMLTGRLPFVGRGIMGLIAAHARETPPDPGLVLAGFPPAASAALMAALSKDPQSRPAASDLVARLEAVADASWPPIERAAPVAGAETRTRQVDVPSPVPSPAANPGHSRRAWILGAVIGGSLAAAAAAIALIVGGGTSAPTPLRVTSIAVHASTLTGHCPRSQWTFTADVVTNGSAGTLRFRWLRPDGKQTPEQTLAVGAHQTREKLLLRFTVTGSRPLQGVATLQGVGSNWRSSSPAVAYSCP
jgi:serine/threonine-protein kinase